MRRIGLILLVAVACGSDDEPMAGGKPLSHWKAEATKVSFFSFWNSEKDQRRAEAFRRLGEMGEQAVPALVDLLRTDKVPVSGDAFNALANLHHRAAGAVPDMIELLDSTSPQLRLRAAWILGTIGAASEPAVGRLTQLLNDPDPKVRSVTARALGQIGGTGHRALDAAGASENPAVREASMRGVAARELSPDERRAYLATGLRDPDPEVRVRAVELLMMVRGDEAAALAEYLMRGLNDTEGRVKHAAQNVLNYYLQHGAATPTLLAEVLAKGDVEARANAAWHLGNPRLRPFGPAYEPNESSVVDALMAALSDHDSKVRVYAARALALGEGTPRDEGLRGLRREIPGAEAVVGVRGARVLYAATRNAAEVSPVYEAGLRDANKWNRVETMSAIIEMGADAEPFRTHFERLQSDPELEVRDRAEKALHWLNERR